MESAFIGGNRLAMAYILEREMMMKFIGLYIYVYTLLW
jgi:hypothetical protein